MTLSEKISTIIGSECSDVKMEVLKNVKNGGGDVKDKNKDGGICGNLKDKNKSIEVYLFHF